MKERVISGAVMTAIVIAMLLIGNIAVNICMGLLAFACYYEIMKVSKDTKVPKIMYFIGIICTLLIVYSDIKVHTGIFGLNYKTLAFVILLLFIPSILIKKNKYKVKDAYLLLSIVLFLGITFNVAIRVFEESKFIFILLLLIACLTDIFALFGGMLIGKHKLSIISPKKTIEGSITGTIFATIICSTLYATFIGNLSFKIVLLIILLSIFGQMGDLFFSLIKRENDVKDYSNFIPGHGGILDRIDSFIFVLLSYVVISIIL